MTHAKAKRKKKRTGKANCITAQEKRAKDKKAFRTDIRLLRHILGHTEPSGNGQDRARGYSRESLAEDLGVSAVTIGRWERGETFVGSAGVREHLEKMIEKHLSKILG